MFKGSTLNNPKDEGRLQQGIRIGDALLDALAAPGLRVAKQRAPAARRHQSAAEAAAGEEGRGRGGPRKQGIPVDIPDVSKEGR